MFVSLNLKNKKFSDLIDNGVVKVDEFGLKFHNVQSHFSMIGPLVKAMVDDKRLVPIFNSLGKYMKKYYSGVNLDEFFLRIGYQGFGVFEHLYNGDKIVITGQSNFCLKTFNEFKKPIKIEVDALLLGLFNEVGDKVFKKSKVVKKTCIAWGDGSCSFEITKA